MGALTEKNQKLSTFDPYINGGRGGLRLVGDNAFWNNFTPRFGLAWSPFPGQNTVVRAGYSIFIASAAIRGQRQFDLCDTRSAAR